MTCLLEVIRQKDDEFCGNYCGKLMIVNFMFLFFF